MGKVEEEQAGGLRKEMAGKGGSKVRALLQRKQEAKAVIGRG